MSPRQKRTFSFTGVVKRDAHATAVRVPFDLAAQWGDFESDSYPVEGTIQGWDFRSVVVARARRFWLVLPGIVVRQQAVDDGDKLRITLAPAS